MTIYGEYKAAPFEELVSMAESGTVVIGALCIRYAEIAIGNTDSK